MILSFSTQINGKPTNFVSKIWVGVEYKFSEFRYKGNKLFNFPKEYILCGEKGLLTFQKPIPKLHTIREDKSNRWKAGTKIDFFINCRQKDMFRFAPVLPVVSIQKIEILWHSKIRSLEYSNLNKKRYNYLDVIVDDELLNVKSIEELAQNDGFDTIDDFFDYFNQDFYGKIIHWTDKRY